jgi:ParB-like chromosome segregation protein Spo0J
MTALPKAFEDASVELPLVRLLPTRALPENYRKGLKFPQIAASIRDIGLIEPVIVSKPDPKSGLHMILDGHLRVEAMKDLERETVTCLVMLDDEGFTYNKRVNRLATIQEHFMILRAVERGVGESRLAKALNLDIKSIRVKRNLLDGICVEVVEMMKDKHFSADMMRQLRKMKPSRQIEAAELMVSLNNFSHSYASALLAATPAEQLLDPEKPKKFKGLSAEQVARMEQEMSLVHSRFKAIEQSYGADVLNMVVTRGYIAKLLANDAVVKFLQTNYPDFLSEFRAIAASGSLEESVAA